MKGVSNEERDMLWYIHDEPSTLQISGSIIHRVVTMNNDFTIDIIDGLVRMYQEMDDEMYKNWSEKRWRHYLPTAFAVSTFNSDIGIESNMAEKLFLGDHISYNVGDGRLVIATLMVDWSWCSYAWDFKRRIISVLDPFSMTEGDAFLEKKHHATVRKMHEAMKYCKKHLFPFPEENMDGWDIENIQVKGGGCDSDDSGLYTMFYARSQAKGRGLT